MHQESNPTNHRLINSGWFQLFLAVIGVVAAVLLLRSPAFASVPEYGLLGQAAAVFVVGLLYSSILTTVPATIALIKLAEAGVPLPLIALIGGLGAMIGDITLFKLMKVGFIDRIVKSIHSKHHEGTVAGMMVRLKAFRYGLILFGALVIATPLPDEIGLALMGFGKARYVVVAAVGLIFNALGIAAIVALTQ